MYESVPDKSVTTAPERKTFYGQVPRSANEMYEHTKSVNENRYTYRLMQITTAIFMNVASMGLKRLKQSRIIFRTLLLKAVTEKTGRSEKSSGVLSGTTEFMQRLCIEWQ